VTASIPPSTWKITERSVEVAQSRAFFWLLFADRALERTRNSGLVMGGLVTESRSCVLALSHVRKCAELAVSTATVPEARLAAKSGLDTFDAAVPRLKDARDFLEHLEDACSTAARTRCRFITGTSSWNSRRWDTPAPLRTAAYTAA